MRAAREAAVIGYSEREIFQGSLIRELQRTKLLVGRIEESVIASVTGHPEIRCHELARAVTAFLSPHWEVVDGKLGHVDHSWLRHRRFILDVYVPGRLPMVQLVDDGSWALPKAGYTPGPLRGDIRENVIDAIRCQLEADAPQLARRTA